VSELSKSELNFHDDEYQLIVAIRATKTAP